MLRRYTRHIWGALLLVSGALALLFNLGIFDRIRPELEYGIASVAGASGLGFLAYYIYHRAQWWPILPGLTLLGASAMIYLGAREAVHSEALASLLLLALAIAFAIVYGADRRNWWAIIPGGILLVIGLVVLLSQRLPFELLGVLLFTGIGLVFFLVYLLGPAKREVWWALIPGTALVLSGLVTYSLTAGRGLLFAQLWPLIPIASGLLLLGRELTKPRITSVNVSATPPAQSKAGASALASRELDEASSLPTTFELEDQDSGVPSGA
ncbi:MAG: hypothetical protein RML36_12505 [Anaerolineae bacterium]|nr:hypothetical protein [Anaerolineae bacterium]MDW8100293.1 hypothetical protein [Anaerolineae bacterium]